MLCPQITETELEFLESKLEVSVIPAKNYYREANSMKNEIGFLFSGLIRVFFIDNFGNQITVKFIKENEFVSHLSAFIVQTPISYNYQCMEQSVIVKFPFTHLKEGYDNFPNLQRYGRLVAEEALKIQQKRLESFLFCSAEERYLNFIRDNADLLERVSIGNLASFLGVERQTLTRIRKRITVNQSFYLSNSIKSDDLIP